LIQLKYTYLVTSFITYPIVICYYLCVDICVYTIDVCYTSNITEIPINGFLKCLVKYLYLVFVISFKLVTPLTSQRAQNVNYAFIELGKTFFIAYTVDCIV